MRHTFCRQMRESEWPDAAHHFLSVWNGDWTNTLPIHHCQGCCQNATDAAELLFAAAVALNIWLSSDVRLPSVDDWGSCGESSGRISLGMMAHDILGQYFNYGCLSWAQIGDLDLEQEHEGEENDIDHVRRKIQKKCWRSQCVLKDSKQRRRMLSLSWLGAPLEALILTLQTLDWKKNGLYWIFRLPVTPSTRFCAAGVPLHPFCVVVVVEDPSHCTLLCFILNTLSLMLRCVS